MRKTKILILKKHTFAVSNFKMVKNLNFDLYIPDRFFPNLINL